MADNRMITHKGKGWYELPDGRRVRGEANARQALNGGGGEKPATLLARLSESVGDPLLAGKLAAMSVTLDRLTWARTHGLQYDSDRDLYKLGGYVINPGWDHYANFYERDPIARRVVDMIPETTWRNQPEVVEPNEPDGTEFTDAWDELASRLDVWQWMEATDKLSRIGNYAVLLVGVTGTTDQTLRTPLRSSLRPEDVLYLKPYSQRHAEIETWVTDTGDPRYGLPELYKIDLAGTVAQFRSALRGKSASALVHASRVIHVAEDTLDDNVYGRPALKCIFNDLFDFAKISTSTAEAFWQRVAGILQAELDADANWTDDDLADLDDALQELYHELRKTVYVQGGKLSRLAETEPDPGPAAKLYMQRISAGGNIPMRQLFGSEIGERSSTEDQKTYLGSISERQHTHAEPVMLRPFIDLLISTGALPRPGEEGYEVVWPPLFQEPEKDRSAANLDRARAAKELTPVGGDPTLLIEIDEDRNVRLLPREEGDASPFEPPEPPEGAVVPGEEEAVIPEEEET